MIQILHISAECYPAAKTGGLADVVGSLPKYMTDAGLGSAAVIPKYKLKWIRDQEWETVHEETVRLDWETFTFRVQKKKSDTLGFPFFVLDIPGLFDRDGIYADSSGTPFKDEVKRYLGFQQAVVRWLLSFPVAHRPSILHCHDHHTGLIPFMIKHCLEYKSLSQIPTVFTIHNGQYQGAFSFDSIRQLPAYEAKAHGLLEWRGVVNPMASALRCAWAVTTVSDSYLKELYENSLGLEQLFWQEWRKQHGIVNGIDTKVWDPTKDKHLKAPFEGDISAFKEKNKKQLCESFGIADDLPLVSFIGRMVHEKGSDMLPEMIRRYISLGGKVNFFILGSGDKKTERQSAALSKMFPGRVNSYIGYSEPLAHLVYAGSDFLIMPSRVEPCGLNQLYSMRYGTIPIVRSVGGLKDTVIDIGDPSHEGRGIRFDQASVDDMFNAVIRASEFYNLEGAKEVLRERLMAIDFSWEKTIERYFKIYRTLSNRI